jgi:hypothetical protein
MVFAFFENFRISFNRRVVLFCKYVLQASGNCFGDDDD